MREDLYVSFTVPAARSRTGTAGFGRVILTVPLSEIAFIAVNLLLATATLCYQKVWEYSHKKCLLVTEKRLLFWEFEGAVLPGFRSKTLLTRCARREILPKNLN